MQYRHHRYIRLDGSSRISERRDMVDDFQTSDFYTHHHHVIILCVFPYTTDKSVACLLQTCYIYCMSVTVL